MTTKPIEKMSNQEREKLASYCKVEYRGVTNLRFAQECAENVSDDGSFCVYRRIENTNRAHLYLYTPIRR